MWRGGIQCSAKPNFSIPNQSMSSQTAREERRRLQQQSEFLAKSVCQQARCPGGLQVGAVEAVGDAIYAISMGVAVHAGGGGE